MQEVVADFNLGAKPPNLFPCQMLWLYGVYMYDKVEDHGHYYTCGLVAVYTKYNTV